MTQDPLSRASCCRPVRLDAASKGFGNLVRQATATQRAQDQSLGAVAASLKLQSTYVLQHLLFRTTGSSAGLETAEKYCSC